MAHSRRSPGGILSSTRHPGAIPLLILALVLSACSSGGVTTSGNSAHASPSTTSTTTRGASASSSVFNASGPIHTSSVPPAQTAIDRQAEAAVNRATPSIVLVQTNTGLGSGVILTSNGYVSTNDHVIRGASQVTVTLATGRSLPATIKGTDPLDDLAILKVNATGLPPATFADSTKLRVGQTVLALGNPLGITGTVTEGIISALARPVNEGQGGGRIPNAIQTSAPINPGNSGGALIDLSGHVVGVPTLAAVNPNQGTAAQGIGFAIPSNKVVYIGDQVITTGTVSHTGQAALGIRAATVTPQLAQQYNLPATTGVLVAGISQNSGAQRAGLAAGDVIVRAGTTPITDNSALLDVLAHHRPGDRLSVTYVTTSGRRRTVSVTLGELPASATG